MYIIHHNTVTWKILVLMSGFSGRLMVVPSSSFFIEGRLGVDEVGRRQEEWEKEIETLDQKETPMT